MKWHKLKYTTWSGVRREGLLTPALGGGPSALVQPRGGGGRSAEEGGPGVPWGWAPAGRGEVEWGGDLLQLSSSELSPQSLS